jgi:hypothetical protein
MSGSERGAARINVDDDDPGTAGDAGTASGAVVDFESAAPTRPEHRRYAPVTCASATALVPRSVAEPHVGNAIVGTENPFVRTP